MRIIHAINFFPEAKLPTHKTKLILWKRKIIFSKKGKHSSAITDMCDMHTNFHVVSDNSIFLAKIHERSFDETGVRIHIVVENNNKPKQLTN